MVVKNLCILVVWTEVALALEGLSSKRYLSYETLHTAPPLSLVSMLVGKFSDLPLTHTYMWGPKPPPDYFG